MRKQLTSLTLLFLFATAIQAQDAATGVVAKNGVLRGRILTKADGAELESVPGLQVSLIYQGKPVKSTYTHSDGVFEFHNIQKEGVYSFYCTGKNGYLAFATTVLTEAGELNDGEFQIEALAVPPSDNRAFFSVLRHQVFMINNPDYNPNLEKLGLSRSEAALANVFFTSKTAKRTLKSTMDLSEVVPSSINIKPLVLSANGTLSGRLQPRFGKTNQTDLRALIFRGGKEFGESWLQADGSFSFENMSPGYYGLAVVGSKGFAVMQVEVVAADANASLEKNNRFVAFQQPIDNDLEAQPLDNTDFQAGHAVAFQQPGADEGDGESTDDGTNETPSAGEGDAPQVTGGGTTGGGGLGGMIGGGLGAAGLATGLSNSGGSSTSGFDANAFQTALTNALAGLNTGGGAAATGGFNATGLGTSATQLSGSLTPAEQAAFASQDFATFTATLQANGNTAGLNALTSVQASLPPGVTTETFFNTLNATQKQQFLTGNLSAVFGSLSAQQQAAYGLTPQTTQNIVNQTSSP